MFRFETYLLLLLLYAGILGLVVFIHLNPCVSSCRFIQEAGSYSTAKDLSLFLLTCHFCLQNEMCLATQQLSKQLLAYEKQVCSRYDFDFFSASALAKKSV